ncbi:hypothetical protein O6H91_06G067400 [Diphasiastrum complanatum]|uniref:Uncharacterized protein n=1 Tax=Diphasiastrum complanatum TaxID=34168 RepID=A0ACC2DEV1_DIPCM|nr:hypothetical protein O6H91_06G067400 [Diphasiastrum complanatum]
MEIRMCVVALSALLARKAVLDALAARGVVERRVLYAHHSLNSHAWLQQCTASEAMILICFGTGSGRDPGEGASFQR